MDEENLNLKSKYKRMLELAGQLKEKKEGSIRTLNKILAKFSIEEGLTLKKTNEYLQAFETVGLIKWNVGKRKWVYNPDAEWELFKVNI